MLKLTSNIILCLMFHNSLVPPENGHIVPISRRSKVQRLASEREQLLPAFL